MYQVSSIHMYLGVLAGYFLFLITAGSVLFLSFFEITQVISLSIKETWVSGTLSENLGDNHRLCSRVGFQINW